MLINFIHHIHLWLFLFLLFMGFLSAYTDAIAGGGGLISLPALMYTGMPVLYAMGTNKFQAAFGTTTAVVKYYKAGVIHWDTVYRGLILGFIGAVLGAYVTNHISNTFMSYLIPFLMIGVFLLNFFNEKIGLVKKSKKLNEKLFFAIFGFFIGFYDAFFGPGSGNLWIISIVYFLGYTFVEASGYAKLLNLKSNLISLAVFLYYKKVVFIYAIIMAIGQVFGGYLGAKTVLIKGSKFVRVFFLFVVFINIVVLSYVMICHPKNLVIV